MSLLLVIVVDHEKMAQQSLIPKDKTPLDTGNTPGCS